MLMSTFLRDMTLSLYKVRMKYHDYMGAAKSAQQTALSMAKAQLPVSTASYKHLHSQSNTKLA